MEKPSVNTVANTDYVSVKEHMNNATIVRHYQVTYLYLVRPEHDIKLLTISLKLSVLGVRNSHKEQMSYHRVLRMQSGNAICESDYDISGIII